MQTAALRHIKWAMKNKIDDLLEEAHFARFYELLTEAAASNPRDEQIKSLASWVREIVRISTQRFLSEKIITPRQFWNLNLTN